MLDSHAIYAWRIGRKRGTVFEAVCYSLGYLLIFPVCLVAPFIIIALWSSRMAFWSAASVTALATICMVITLFGAFASTRREKLEAIGHTTVFAGMIPVFALFLLSVPASPLAAGFSISGDPTLNSSLLIVADNFLKVLFLDLPEICDVHLTTARPEAWYAQATSVAIRLAFGLGLVGVFVRLFKSVYSAEDFFGTPEECHAFCDAKMDPENLEIGRCGQVERLSEEVPIEWSQLVKVAENASNKPTSDEFVAESPTREPVPV